MDFSRLCELFLPDQGAMARKPKMLHGSLVHAIPASNKKYYKEYGYDNYGALVDKKFECGTCAELLHIRQFPVLGNALWNTTDWNMHSGECIQCADRRRETLNVSVFYSKELASFCDVLIGQIVSGAATRSRAVSLRCIDLIELFVQQRGRCALSSVPLELTSGKGRQNFKKASIDRIDNNFAYCMGNVQFVCWGVNRMKHDMGLQEFLSWCSAIVATQAEKESVFDEFA
jgi:hypothetical protein